MTSEDNSFDKETVIFLLLTGVIGTIFIAAVAKRICIEMQRNIEQEKLSAITELAGAAAHEMRQPMTVVHNLIILLHEKFKRRHRVSKNQS